MAFSAPGVGWADAITSLSNAVPGIIQTNNEYQYALLQRGYDQKARDILANMPEYGSDPTLAQHANNWLNASDSDKQQAVAALQSGAAPAALNTALSRGNAPITAANPDISAQVQKIASLVAPNSATAQSVNSIVNAPPGAVPSQQQIENSPLLPGQNNHRFQLNAAQQAGAPANPTPTPSQPPYPDPDDTGNSGLQSLTAAPAPTTIPPDQLNTQLDTIRSVESGNGSNVAHPQAANGLQAVGQYGIVPSIWFKALPQFGLDASNPKDVQKFANDPDLQRQMASVIWQQAMNKANGDPRAAREIYYSGSAAAIGTTKEWQPQYAYQTDPATGKKVQIQMPSIGDDADRFMQALGNGPGTQQQGGAPPSGMQGVRNDIAPPAQNAALAAIAANKPTQDKDLNTVSYEDQEGYLMRNIKDPQVFSRLKDFVDFTHTLAQQEHQEDIESQSNFNTKMGQYIDANDKLSQQALEVWKEKYTTANKQPRVGDPAAEQQRLYMQQLGNEAQNDLDKATQFRVSYINAAPAQQNQLATLYPQFFDAPVEKSNFFGTKSVNYNFNEKKFEDYMNAKRSTIDQLNQAIGAKVGINPGAGPQQDTSARAYFGN